MAYLLNILIALDQLLNVVFCAGEPDETMSSNAWRMEQAGKPWGFMRAVIDALLFFDPDHCASSFIAERERRHLPPEFRQ